MLMLLVLVIFFFTGMTIFFYLRSSFRLLEDLQCHAPQVWEQLRKPERIYVRKASGGFHTIKPLLPWMGWMLRGMTTGLTEDLAKDLVKTRRLFIAGLVLFCFAAGCFLLLMAQQP